MRSDRWLIFGSAGLRAVAVGLSGVILALHFATVGLDASSIGFIVSLGLAGCACGTFAVTYLSEHWGRRTTLVILSFMMALGGILLVFVTRPSVIMVSAFFGMVNGMGRDRGAGLTVEQAMLPQTTTETKRTSTFAWYNLVVDGGHALGALLGGFPAFLRSQAGLTFLASYQWTWALYSVLCLLAGSLVFFLSRFVELKGSQPVQHLSSPSRLVVAKFAALSGLDSLGGGFLTSALLGYWFFMRFGVNESLLGPLFFLVRIANGLSHLGAAWIAKRIGLVNTMVFTHLPSSLLLMTVPFAPNLTVAIVLFLLRESLVEMDVPTRQSYIVAVVKEEERTRAAGITNLTRNVAWAVAPAVAGSLMRIFSLSAPLFIGPGLKIVYDLLLYRAFRHLRPPEERNPAT
ncbi:MAG: MFS transporter [Candidatus Omnitrophica bacterium]|nr:MFS transporter [Candidatus Omnitrophota bacterium]